MKGEGAGEGEDEIGMEARGGLGGRAGRTVAELDWTLAWIRFSISSMSDWEDRERESACGGDGSGHRRFAKKCSQLHSFDAALVFGQSCFGTP